MILNAADLIKLQPKRTAEPQKRGRRGDGSIEKLPTGKFRAVFPLGIDPATGKRRKLSQNFATRKEAKDWLAKKRTESVNGRIITAARMTVGEWLVKWLDRRKPDVAPMTYVHDKWRAVNHLIPRLGTVSLRDLGPSHVADLLAGMAKDGKSNSERHKAGKVLRAALSDAVRERLVPTNVVKEVKLPKAKRSEKTALDAKQAVALLSAASGHRLSALFYLALDAGPRPGEMYALLWTDLNFDARTVTIRRTLEEINGRMRTKEPKTASSRRTVKLAKRTIEALRLHRELMRAEGHDVDTGILFPGRQGGYLRQSNFLRKVFRPILRAGGLPTIRVYDLRHTAATFFALRGINPVIVKDRLGHDDIQTTHKYYTHVLREMQDQAPDAIDDLFSTVSPPVVPFSLKTSSDNEANQTPQIEVA
jgi:integrase